MVHKRRGGVLELLSWDNREVLTAVRDRHREDLNDSCRLARYGNEKKRNAMETLHCYLKSPLFIIV